MAAGSALAAAKTQAAVLDRASKQVVAIDKAEMDAMRAALAKREADTPDVVVAAALRALNDKKPKPRGRGGQRSQQTGEAAPFAGPDARPSASERVWRSKATRLTGHRIGLPSRDSQHRQESQPPRFIVLDLQNIKGTGGLEMRLPDRILHTPFLLGFKRETPHYAGCGFVVAVPGAHGNSHLYVVTAKHLAQRMECCPIIMGFSYRDGTKALLEADSVHWYAHPTEASAVDVAVTPFASAQRDLLDIEPVPEHLFISGERMRKASIAVGDEITAIGVFTRFSYHDDRHVPIVRTGHLAMLPTLRIPVRDFEPMEAYVAEIEGLSGSPVWVRPTDYFNAAQKGGREEKPAVPVNGDTDVIFLGLLQGRWAISKGAMEGQSAQYTEQMVSSMSIIVPAHKILEVIDQPELAAMRRRNDEKIAKRSSSVGS